MPKQRDTRSLVDEFVAELTAVVQADALDVVRTALGVGPVPKRRGPGRRRKAGKRGPGRPPKAASRRGPGRPRQSAGRVRRSSADLEATAAKILAYVRANPGQRLEEIGRGLRTDTAGLKRPIQVLVADKRLRTEGQKRGTRYFAGGRGGGKPKAAKKTRKTKRGRRVARRAKRKTRPTPRRSKVGQRGRRKAPRKSRRKTAKRTKAPARRGVGKKVRQIARKVRKALEPKPIPPGSVPLWPEPGTIL